MRDTERPLDEINRLGVDALVTALGNRDAERFIEHCRTGIADYTRERHRWLDNLRREDILNSIEQMQGSAGVGDTQRGDDDADDGELSTYVAPSYSLSESAR